MSSPRRFPIWQRHEPGARSLARRPARRQIYLCRSGSGEISSTTTMHPRLPSHSRSRATASTPSLPPRTSWTTLLPDAEHTRIRMARTYGAADPTAFASAGKGRPGSGWRVGTPAGGNRAVGRTRRHASGTRSRPCQPDQQHQEDADAWVPAGHAARFSLAGTQGKFAMAKIAGDWYWSNEKCLDPHREAGNPRLEHVEEAESAGFVAWPGALGLMSHRAEILSVEDQQAFMVERFDRVSQPIPFFRSAFMPRIWHRPWASAPKTSTT